MTALHLACFNNQYTKVKTLVATFPSLIDQNDGGLTPLMMCCNLNNVRLVKLLVDNNANLTLVDKVGSTALMISAEHGYLQVVNVLVRAGADLEASDQFGKTALQLAAEQERLDVIKLLLNAGANPTSRKARGGMTALHTAARHGRLAVLEVLFDGGAPLSCAVSDVKQSCVPLDMACIGGHTGVVRWMLSRGLNKCGGPSRGQQAFEFASFSGFVEILQLLAREGVRGTGQALICAVYGCKERSVRYILNQYKELSTGRNQGVDYRDENGRTALMLAVGKYFSPKIVRWLIDAGADTTKKIENYTLPDYVKKLMAGQAEENLQKLGAIRQLLLREDAVHSKSWLWPSESTERGTSGSGTPRGTPSINLVRRRGFNTSRVVLGGLLRYTAKSD